MSTADHFAQIAQLESALANMRSIADHQTRLSCELRAELDAETASHTQTLAELALVKEALAASEAERRRIWSARFDKLDELYDHVNAKERDSIRFLLEHGDAIDEQVGRGALMFGVTPEEANERRAACSRSETCTLCGSPAGAKVEEDTFGEPRHPLTAYVCSLCFERIMMPYRHGHAVRRLELRLLEARCRAFLLYLSHRLDDRDEAWFARWDKRSDRVIEILEATRKELANVDR